jgi:DNA sulfur modification protein DndD
MILKSIELTNFMCYYGQNKFDFEEGINVIIGDNGYGKSKLFDAFYWVMYDKCFDTSVKEFKTTRLLNKSLISDKALFETTDGYINVSVILQFHNTEKDCIYFIERKYGARKLGEEIKADTESEEIVSWKELSFMNSRVITDPLKIELIKKSILPDNIKPYMWFQGEQVESIIDFNSSNTLTQAINILSNISRFDEINKVTACLKESSLAELNRKQRALSKDRGRSEELEIARENAVKKIKRLEKLELEQRDNLGIAEEKADQLFGKIDDAQKIKELETKRKTIESLLSDVLAQEKIEQIALHKKMFTNKWVLKGTEDLFEKYKTIYSKYEEKKLNKVAEIKARLEIENEVIKQMQTRLPIDVPEPIYVERMLEIERCLVCDREALKDSEAWNKIKELLDRSQMKIKEFKDKEITKHDFSNELKRLFHNGLGLGHVMKNIEDNIKESYISLDKLTKRRKDLSEELEKVEKEVKGLIAEASIDVNQATNFLSEYQAQLDFAKRFQRELTSTEISIEKAKGDLEITNKELADLVTGEIPEFLRNKVQVLEDLYHVTHATRDRVFKKLVEMLEFEANKHYQEMTQDNLSARGIIRLKKFSNDNYMPELVDNNGRVLLQLNTGNIILIKLATIMAIISARKSSRDTDLYTLITDAPMSVFGEDYTIGFCKTVSKVYRQSIIMSKEFYKNASLRKELLSNKDIKLGKVYMITPSIPTSERTNRDSLLTLIKPLN